MEAPLWGIVVDGGERSRLLSSTTGCQTWLGLVAGFVRLLWAWWFDRHRFALSRREG